MIYKNVNIESFGYELAPEVITSDDIEKKLSPVYERLKLPFGRLEMMSGIKERRFWKPGTMPSDAAILAGRSALEESKIEKKDIGCLIMCSVCRDFLEPATATVVHSALGLPEDAIVFDISNACLGILTGMITAANMIELGQIRAALLVAGENSRPLLESTIRVMLDDKSLTRQSIKKYFSSLTIGSGSVAVVLADRKISSSNHKFIGGHSLAVTSHNRLCRGNADKGMSDNTETLMSTDSEELMLKGVEVAASTWKLFKKELGWTNDTPDCFCTHQVGSAHRKLMYETLGINIEKDFPTLSSLGNVGSVSCPITAALAVKEGKVRTGQKLALLGIGSGINCTMLGVEW
ncbi:MAG TPA: 3-oxoacyl-ACP synthase III [Lentisphaeria bacterium]|nr:MAG: 3-oxoacyl-ACP synthase III [Lentisphaerae bacterium GWF2_49_21]HBC87570.1 3-oxoacyl-ACP synthase III [Lentisphaeria bacterium]